MLLFPNAKINLGLHIMGVLPNGYHSIETVFIPVPLCDELSVESAEEDSFDELGISVRCPPEHNLVLRAISAFRRFYREDIPPLSVRLTKRIPVGAGLGGGSSDAAFTLKALRDMFMPRLNAKQLEELAQTLGADCPFFLRNVPTLATDMGNIFSPILPVLQGYYVVLVMPSVAISTSEAYKLSSLRQPVYDLCKLLSNEKPERWRGILKNDFEDVVFPRYPLLADLKQRLYEQGAAYASLSGSGSTLFGIFARKPVHIREKFSDCPVEHHVECYQM
ncbi:MAG: 4-(cytidine 5'-diphospho)-2-C-methyl-D-erythritol kinase [Tannerellaceae bacterium]|jgi:4-diphosphocytidyl-2-C-methyl-D-erythritol kinase|nr:4-(cytidine 5'-diphospho)-2-C-methyl-D-erythritol kinase [Tannerellaceae bacterium]